MKKLVAIGEALIDFIPQQTGCKVKDVKGFTPVVGGAPANVCGAFAKLGGRAEMITQLGEDPFGDKIVEELKSFGIGCEYISRTTQANTSLAFVALEEDGNREFSFYRKMGADMLLEEDAIENEWFEDTYALHFCSVSLGAFPMKDAHKRAIRYAKEHGAVISFDPNLRFPLWEDKKELRKAVLEFLPFADIVKISEEELFFITGCTDMEHAKEELFARDIKLILYTKGEDGAEAYTPSVMAEAGQRKVKAIDTTGAGDAFIGSILYNLAKDEVAKDKIAYLEKEQLTAYLTYGNEYCRESVQKHGAIASYPTAEEMKQIINK